MSKSYFRYNDSETSQDTTISRLHDELERNTKAPTYHTRQSEKNCQVPFQSKSSVESSSESESETKSNGSSSSSPNSKSKKMDVNIPEIEHEREECDVIRRKDLEVREAIRWKIKGSKKHLYNALQLTQIRRIKGPSKKYIKSTPRIYMNTQTLRNGSMSMS